MASRPGDCNDESSFTLLSHIEENLGQTESIERIVDNFSRISQEFPPLSITMLPDEVKVKVLAPTNPQVPSPWGFTT